MSLIEHQLVQFHPVYINTDAAYYSSMCVHHIAPHDMARQSEYQRLRTAIFVQQLGWDVPVDEEGRERDHYDLRDDPSISVHCVYGEHANTEYLLGGVRIFELHSWNNSMVTNEFRTVGMIPDSVLTCLKNQYDYHQLLELTRFCVQRGRWYTPPSISTRFNCVTARDLTYAAVYKMAEKTGRWKALALVDTNYLQVMKRSHFVFQQLYTHYTREKFGYSLTIIDLYATLRAIRAAGEFARAERMIALCTETTRLTL